MAVLNRSQSDSTTSSPFITATATAKARNGSGVRTRIVLSRTLPAALTIGFFNDFGSRGQSLAVRKDLLSDERPPGLRMEVDADRASLKPAS